MKTKKLIIYAFLFVAVFVNKVAAQQHKHEKNGDFLTKEFKEKLNLTDEQKTKIQNILMLQRKEIREKMQANPNMTNQEKAALRKEIMKQTDDKIMEVLNDNQKAIYKSEIEKIRGEMKEKAKEKRHSRR
ncbi:MAG: hypothetical protein ACK4K9_01770 [Bacteroidia bacterium]